MMMNRPTSSRWNDDAACRTVDPALFHPERNRDGPRAVAIALAAISVCERCQVRGQCLDWAITVDDKLAVLGGLTAVQRGVLARHGMADYSDWLKAAVDPDGPLAQTEAA